MPRRSNSIQLVGIVPGSISLQLAVGMVPPGSISTQLPVLFLGDFVRASRPVSRRPLSSIGAALKLAGLGVLFLIAPCLIAAKPRPSTSDVDLPGLSRSFTRAADAVRRGQQAAGYWSTAVTPGPAFATVTSETNTFTPAIIVDLLGPVAAEAGLGDVLDRARDYLRRQIEPTGLVRYHGNPGPVEASQRGCELPPDVDDTSLTWRIAPREEPELLREARGAIQQYRAESGLYRTWIADPQAYRCFYTAFFPRDPNPADVGIQMHAYLFFDKYDRDAARALCTALRGRLGDSRIWVWYARAPLLPLLREVDLARAGCRLRVSDERLHTAVPGQDLYMTQGRLFRELLAGSEGTSIRKRAISLLAELATADFERIAENPPLLYHNALSASPPHYHWSSEVGYALWLRLYVEVARRSEGALAIPPVR
jgi:hypothetical protein